MYNMTFLDTNTTLVEFMVGINDTSNTMIFSLIVFAIWLVAFVATKHYDTRVAFITAFFISTVVGISFMFLQLIGFGVVVTCVVGLILSIIFYKFAGD